MLVLTTMTAQNLVRPLEDAWQNVIDATLRERGAPITSDIRRLGPKVMALSRTYNASLAGHAGHGEGASARALALDALEARIGFSFARDVPKGAGAVRELVASGKLTIPHERPLRIVDVGAGLGAMTWGIARALEAANQSGSIDALFIDDDEAVLSVAKAMADTAQRSLPSAKVKLAVLTRTADIQPALRLPQADLVVVGQVLSELDLALAASERALRHAAMLAGWLATSVNRGGALVVIEPALRDRTRHLHAVRDALIAAGKAYVFAPCLHNQNCPALSAQGQWCHEDLDVDLPTWLAPLARGAGLRWQGLSFSYLVLQPDRFRFDAISSLAAPVRSSKPEEAVPVRSSPTASISRQLESGLGPTLRGLHLRVISDVMRTKGKVEIFGCTSKGERVRFRRLDRDANPNNLAWNNLCRGDIVALLPGANAPGASVEKGGRLCPDATVRVWPTYGGAHLR